ncbi:hypothetical protein PTKIN_Ptkin05aG0211400 [Pterospermum kingtungense]
MAFRLTGYMKQIIASTLRGKATYATSTPPKLTPYSPTANFGRYTQDAKPPKKVRGDFVPIYVAIGMIALSTMLGLHTAMQQLKNSPQVRVNKKRRETLPEVEEPDRVLDEVDKLMKQSFFRKVAHVQEDRDVDFTVDDPAVRSDIFVHKPQAETLKSVGVNPKFRVIDG